MLTLSKNVSLITENYFILQPKLGENNLGIHNSGFRFFGRNFHFDIGIAMLANKQKESDLFFSSPITKTFNVYPYVGLGWVIK